MSARAVVVYHDVRLSCRCVVWVDREDLFRLVPGGVLRCRNHGARAILSRTPRPDPWERKVRRVVRDASRG